MTASLLGLGWLLAGSLALAQEAPRPAWDVTPSPPTQTLHYTKPPAALVAPTPAPVPPPTVYQAPAVETPKVPPPAPRLMLQERPVSTMPMPTATMNLPDPVPPPASLGSSRTIQQAQFMQQPRVPPVPGGRMPGTDETQESLIQLEPPGPQRLFRLEPESSFQLRYQQEAKERRAPDRIEFPTDEPLVAGGSPIDRHYPAANLQVEPNYVCYGRLYFNDLNAERYGWDLGPIQPLLLTGKFFLDVALLPYHMGTDPCRCTECSAGYCLPGDPVPYLCYPPEVSLTGVMAEAGAVVGVMAIFP